MTALSNNTFKTSQAFVCTAYIKTCFLYTPSFLKAVLRHTVMFKTRKLRTLRLTAGAPTEHGQSLENHFMEEESNGFIFQLVLQQVAVVIHIPALAGNGDPLKKRKMA